MLIFRKQKIIPVILTAAFLIAAVFFAYKKHHSFANVAVISAESFENRKLGKIEMTKAPDLFYNNMAAQYDEAAKCYLISISNGKTPSGRIYVKNGGNVYFEEGIYTKHPELLSREAGEIHTIISDSDGYFETNLRFTNLPIVALDNSEIEINDNSHTVTVNETNKKYKLYEISEKDSTFIREALAFTIWNSICEKELKKDFSIVRAYLDNEYMGLYVKSEANPGKKGLISAEYPEIEAFSDYLLFLNIIYGYDNVDDHYHLVDSKDGIKVLPTRIKYCLGNYSDSNEYLSYKVENRVIKPEDFGIDDEEYIENTNELVKSKYVNYRKSAISDEKLLEMAEKLINEMDNSGQVAMYSSFDGFNDAVSLLLDFIQIRMEGMDKYFGIKQVEIEKPQINEFEEIYAIIDDKEITKVKLYIDSEGVVLFLPGSFNKDCVKIQFDNSIYDVSIDGRALDCDGQKIEINREHDINVVKHNEVGSAEISAKLTIMKSSGIPTVFMDNANGNTEYLYEKGKHHTHTEPGNILCKNADGSIDYDGQIKEIRFRGHTSYGSEKKNSYQVELEEAADILSMGKAEKWILQANHYDKTRMRNHIIYNLCRKIGMEGAVDDKYADVYLNGEYLGNFLICEKPEVYPGRVEVSADGYYFETTEPIRLHSEYYGIEADGISYRIRYPKVPTDEKRLELADALTDLRACIEKSEPGDINVIEANMELGSFADMFLINHMTNHMDANRFSTYYRYQNETLYAGPAWDYDQSFGNSLVEKNETYYGNNYRDGWPEYLYKFDDYRKLCFDKWRLVHKPYFEEAISDDGFIDQVFAEIEASLKMDYRRNISFEQNEISSEISQLKKYISERIKLMDEIADNPDGFAKVSDEENKVSNWIRK